MPKFVVLAGLIAGVAVQAQAQPVTADQLMQHIRTLADDGFEGRAAGTAGGERTEAYILEAFAKARLQPGMEQGWRQTVNVTERTPDKTAITFNAAGRSVAFPKDRIVLSGRNPTVEFKDAPVIFVGHGTEAQMAGLDVTGAVVLMIPGNPLGTSGGPSWQDRRAAFGAAGAAAVITIDAASVSWKHVLPESRTSVDSADGPFPLAQGPMAHEAAIAVLGAAGEDARALLASIDRPGFKARRLPLTATARVDTHIAALSPANIVGMVKGTGDRREAVVLLAHWDHTGLCQPEGSADRICNGAVDNASGIAVLIETARAVAAGPRPVRDIYFVATTLEERGGFLGAAAFATDGPPWLDRIVAVLNVDSLAIHPRGIPVAILGRGRFSQLDAVIDATARKLGRGIDLDSEANIMLERQDGWAFASRGIPSVMASSSFSDMTVLRKYLSSTYHQPNDDLNQKIELGGALEDADLHIALLQALADPSIYPTPAAPAVTLGQRP